MNSIKYVAGHSQFSFWASGSFLHVAYYGWQQFLANEPTKNKNQLKYCDAVSH